MLSNGDRSPDFTLLAVDGHAVPLSDALRDSRHVLLVFLRHLG